MRAGNCLSSLAEAMYSALLQDLPAIEYHQWTPVMKKDGIPQSEAPLTTRRPTEDDVSLYHFDQTWGSTTLGFGGIGGQAITSAYTTVVMSGISASVYFAGRHAYCIDKVSPEFIVDLLSHNMAACEDIKRYCA